MQTPLSSAPLAVLAWPAKPSDSVLGNPTSTTKGKGRISMALYWGPEDFAHGIVASFVFYLMLTAGFRAWENAGAFIFTRM